MQGAGTNTNITQSLPAVNAAEPTGAVAGPEFDADLIKEQLQPIVLQTLLDIRPRSCSALDLSKLIWPQETAMRSCMKRMLSFFLASTNAVCAWSCEYDLFIWFI